LILYDGDYYLGNFNKVWFGWNFNEWYAPLQFDAPEYNKSSWQMIWKIKI